MTMSAQRTGKKYFDPQDGIRVQRPYMRYDLPIRSLLWLIQLSLGRRFLHLLWKEAGKRHIRKNTIFQGSKTPAIYGLYLMLMIRTYALKKYEFESNEK
jgi:hypothetical protein